VFYGFYHQRSISVSQRSEAAQRAYDHKLELIAKAKAEYAKSKQPASATAKAGGGE
jgi:F-type H+-transporting ATP synthase subunit e